MSLFPIGVSSPVIPTRPPVVAPRPGAPHRVTFAGGSPRARYKLSLPRLISLTRQDSPWQARVAELLDAYERRDLQAELPLVKKILAPFALEGCMGIPPALNRFDPDRKNMRLQSTNGALAVVALEILGQLPPAANAMEAFVQLNDVLRQLSARAVEKARGLTGDWQPSNGISLGFFRARGLEHVGYSQVLTGHILLIAPNGAVQILKVPTPAELITLIDHDPKAQEAINRHRPVKPDRWGFFRMPSLKRGYDLAQTRQFLSEMAQGRHRHRVVNGWSDVHTLLRDVPFDFARHVREGRIPVLFDKAGADGRKVTLSDP